MRHPQTGTIKLQYVIQFTQSAVAFRLFVISFVEICGFAATITQIESSSTVVDC